MTSETTIRYVTHQSIDKSKWDKCIDDSPNGLVYACSWYLDNMAKHWDALILNDYEAVMPLTWNKKWGVRYLYQPPITPQLGVFSAYEITSSLVERFLAEVRRHFRFAEIYLNYDNAFPGLRVHTNYILSLNRPYSDIYNGYKKSLVKNLNRSAKFHLRYEKDFDLKMALRLYQQRYAIKTPHVKAHDYRRFEKLCSLAQSNGHVLVRAVYDQADQLLAVSMLLNKRGRMYLLASTTLPAGRDLEANHFLMDSLIREFSGTDMILDFDGSDIPGIAYYYSTFGGINQPFFFYRYNQLPWFIKWLKN